MHAPKPNTITYNTAIKKCERPGKWEYALCLLHDLRFKRLEADAVTYGCAISACATREGWQHSLLLLDAMCSQWSILDSITYANVPKTCGRREQNNCRWGLALQLMFAHSSAIGACEKGGQWELSLHVLHAMSRRWLQPALVAFNSAISACSKHARWEQALQLIAEMRRKSLDPDVTSCTLVMGGCVSTQHFEQALQFEATMPINLRGTSTNMYRLAVNAREKGELWEAALLMLESVKQMNSPKRGCGAQGGPSGRRPVSDPRSALSRALVRPHPPAVASLAIPQLWSGAPRTAKVRQPPQDRKVYRL